MKIDFIFVATLHQIWQTSIMTTVSYANHQVCQLSSMPNHMFIENQNFSSYEEIIDQFFVPITNLNHYFDVHRITSEKLIGYSNLIDARFLRFSPT